MKASYYFYPNNPVPFFCFMEGDKMFDSIYEYRIYFEENKDSVYVIRSTKKHIDLSPNYWEDNPGATKRSENIKDYPSKPMHEIKKELENNLVLVFNCICNSKPTTISCISLQLNILIN